jgi:carbon-monoxide dehydrogenase large subunit
MEPRSTIAEIDRNRAADPARTTQTPGSTRDVLAEAILKRPKESVRVLVGDIGGGFGQKTNLYPEDGMVAYAAVKLACSGAGAATAPTSRRRHPCRDLTSTGESRSTPKAGAGLSGALGRRHRRLFTGAGTIIPLVLGPFVQSGVYDLLVHYEVKADDAYRTGRCLSRRPPEGVFIVERLDAAARQIGMDPRAICKVNYIKPAQLPYTNAVGQVYDRRVRAHAGARLSFRTGGLCCAQEGGQEEGSLMAAASPAISNGLAARAYRKGQPARDGRRARHPAFRHAGDGTGLQTTYRR